MNKTCKLCGAKYDYCPSCEKDADKPRWMILFHDANCNKIFDTLQRHTQGIYSDTEAVHALRECDLSVIKKATESIRNQIAHILSTAKPVVKKPQVKKEKYSE